MERLESFKQYVIRIKHLKQAFNHGSVFKKVNKVIKSSQKAWMILYVFMNADLWKKAKNDFEKKFFKFMNNLVIGKTMENVRKHKDIKFGTTEARRKYLTSELYNKFFSKNF